MSSGWTGILLQGRTLHSVPRRWIVHYWQQHRLLAFYGVPFPSPPGSSTVRGLQDGSAPLTVLIRVISHIAAGSMSQIRLDTALCPGWNSIHNINVHTGGVPSLRGRSLLESDRGHRWPRCIPVDKWITGRLFSDPALPMAAAVARLKDEVDLVFEAQGPQKGTSVDAGARQVSGISVQN